MIQFFVPGKPVGKGRPRFTRTGHTYTPGKTRAYEAAVAWECRKAMEGKLPSVHPQRVSVEVMVKPPKSWSKAKTKNALGGLIAPGRPDIDNYLKAVLDGCNGVAFLDDSQVVAVYATKRYAETDGVRVIIEEKTYG